MEIQSFLTNIVKNLLIGSYPYAHKLYRPVRALEEEYRMLPVKNYAVFYVVREQDKVIECYRITQKHKK